MQLAYTHHDRHVVQKMKTKKLVYKHIPYGIKIAFTQQWMSKKLKRQLEEMAKNLKEPIKFGPIGRVVIELIDHQDQRYETVGDWYRQTHFDVLRDLIPLKRDDECDLHIRASRLHSDPDNLFALAVAYHELGEALACIANGVDESVVDAFDKTYRGSGEPGDDPKSPYRQFHNFASACESILIGAMGLSWGVYEKAVDSLPKWRKGKK